MLWPSFRLQDLLWASLFGWRWRILNRFNYKKGFLTVFFLLRHLLDWRQIHFWIKRIIRGGIAERIKASANTTRRSGWKAEMSVAYVKQGLKQSKIVIFKCCHHPGGSFVYLQLKNIKQIYTQSIHLPIHLTHELILGMQPSLLLSQLSF